MISTLCRAFVDARAFKDFGKHLSDLILDDFLGIVRIELWMPAHEFLCPIRMLGKRFGRSEVFTVQECLFEVSHLFFQPSRQDRQTHNCGCRPCATQ